MTPERIVQLALGVPDAIDVSRRRESAVVNLGLLGGLNRDYIEEAAETTAPVYDALIAALAAGDMDGAIAGWSDTARPIRTITKRARQTGIHPSTTEQLVSAGVEAIVDWAIKHPRLDDVIH